MRLVPDTLFGRVAGVLGIGLVLTLGAALLALGLTLHAGGPAYPAQIQRIATAVAIADRLPPAARAQVGWGRWHGPGVTAPGMPPGVRPDAGWTWQGEGAGPGGPPPGRGDRGVRLLWPAPGPVPGGEASGWRARHLRVDLTEALARAGVDGPVIVTNGLPRPGEAVPDRDRPSRRLFAQVRLSDGTWAAVPLPGREFGGPGLLPGLVAALAVFSAGVAALAVWSARRATAPLKELAEAARRLEAAGDGAPVAVTGPREVRQAAHALNEMQGRIRRFVEDRTRMLAAISHDLRTMLTRLSLRAEYIDDPEQRAKALKDLAEMEEMLAATLAFARDDAKAEARTPVDLAALLADLADDLAEAGHKAAYAGPRACTVHARPTALRRAFTNVLNNAVAYGGAAEVALTEGDGAVRVTVSDRGPGIPDPLKEQVFAPFYRVETSRSRETGGTGLGLSVALDIVRAHGGDIALSDREGGGLVVTVTLPKGEPAA